MRQRGHHVWRPTRQREPNWVKQGNVDIVAASTFDPLTYFKIIKFKKKFQAAVVIHAHTTLEDMKGNFVPDNDFFNGFLKLWLRILYGACHLLITPSYYSKKCIEDIQKSLTYPIHAVSNGIKLENFEEKQEYRSNFRNFLNKKYKIPLDATVILNVGLSWKKKGVDRFGKIAKALPNYYFIWVGPINKNPDIEIAQKIENVIFTGFYDNICEPYYGADIFLNTSYNENQGIPLIEAAICQLPMIVSDLPAYDWVEHDKTCIKAEEIENYIKGINKILSDDNYRNNLIANAKFMAEELHDFNKIGDKIEALYSKAIKINKIKNRLQGKIIK